MQSNVYYDGFMTRMRYEILLLFMQSNLKIKDYVYTI
jgi:hypothetical protein